MKETLEAWRFGDPADVVERIELQANAAAAREMQKLNERLAAGFDKTRRAEQERIRAKVFKGAK